jgi:hypothetical protein
MAETDWGPAPAYWRPNIAPGYVGFNSKSPVGESILDCWVNCSIDEKCQDPPEGTSFRRWKDAGGKFPRMPDQTVLQLCVYGPGQAFEMPSTAVSPLSRRNERVAIFGESSDCKPSHVCEPSPYMHGSRSFWEWYDPPGAFDLAKLVVRTSRTGGTSMLSAGWPQWPGPSFTNPEKAKGWAQKVVKTGLGHP